MKSHTGKTKVNHDHVLKLTERDIEQSFGDGGWVHENSAYNLTSEQIDELVKIAKADADKQDILKQLLPHVFLGFCWKCERYFGYKHRNKIKKITTELRDKRSTITRLAGELLAELSYIEHREAKWLFGKSFGSTNQTLEFIGDMQINLAYLQRNIASVEIEVVPSPATNLARECIISLISLYEASSGRKVNKAYDAYKEKGSTPFYNFTREFFSYLPPKLLAHLEIKPERMEKAIANAIKEHNKKHNHPSVPIAG